MGVLYDYFSAAGDDAAASALDAGPAGRFPTLEDTGIDPAIHCASLEEILTGRPYVEVVADTRWAAAPATRDGGERSVLTLTDSLASALSDATPKELTRAAAEWSRTEELVGAEPEVLEAFLSDLAALALRARADGDRLYCWVCV